MKKLRIKKGYRRVRSGKIREGDEWANDNRTGWEPVYKDWYGDPVKEYDDAWTDYSGIIRRVKPRRKA